MSTRYRLDRDDVTGTLTVTTRKGLTLPAWWEGLEIQQGSSLYLPINVIDGDTSEPWALATYTARLKVKSAYGATASIESLTHADGITLASTLPNVLVQRTGAQTAAYTFTGGVFDLELIDASSVVYTVLAGTVVLRKEATT